MPGCLFSGNITDPHIPAQCILTVMSFPEVGIRHIPGVHDPGNTTAQELFRKHRTPSGLTDETRSLQIPCRLPQGVYDIAGGKAFDQTIPIQRR